jgi:glycosyltransferase involved in cell wall biosynthesis
MFVSTIIPTVGRSTLGASVASVLGQGFREAPFEVVVVNDSGRPLPDAPWQRAPGVTVVDSNRVERGAARNAGASVARGEFLHFLDDDDVLLPRALEWFWRLQAQASHAAWLYGAWEVLDRDGAFVKECRPRLNGDVFSLLVAGEGLPLQASLFRARAFWRVGGFATGRYVCGVEDRDLGRRLAIEESLAYIDHVVARVHVGEAGSTTEWDAIGRRDRVGRELVLRDRNALRRIREAGLSAYWRGRVVRAYLGSALLNLSDGRPQVACRRVLEGGALTHVHCLRRSFWRGVRRAPASVQARPA